ncbi:FAD-dependent oxidoreductase [Mycolicibacterium vaccae]|uniref:FAD-dependent oxidoreductase n=1 Tax=Mycolicibacterium vaccae TaxID=1810 RepID=UPI003D04DCDE
MGTENVAQHDVDLAVVGTGIGGLTAAIVAADHGLRVLLIERSDRLGGVGAVSGGAAWLPLTRFGAEGNAGDSYEQVMDYLNFLSAGHGTTAHRERFAASVADATHYLADQAGVQWSLVKGCVDNYAPWAPGVVPNCRMLEVEPIDGTELAEWQELTRRSPFFPPGLKFSEMRDPGSLSESLGALIAQRRDTDARAAGEGLLAYLVKAALVDRGIPVLLNTRADSLITADGRVSGLRCDDGTEIRAARGVVLATGGYDWNTANQIETSPGFSSSAPAVVTGDHLVMAGEIGAAITVLPTVGMHTQLGYSLPTEEYEGKPLWRWALYEAAARHSIIVNDQGERFCDETWFFQQQDQLRDFDSVNRRYRNVPAYLIIDQNHRDQTRFGPYAAGRPLPEPFVTSDSLEGLAEQLGLPADRLLETVHRFNGFCQNGKDEDFGRGDKALIDFLYPSSDGSSTVLGPIERGPFYAIELTLGGLGSNNAGLQTDPDTVVQHVRGRSIDGLYAVGNAAAHLDFGPVYVSGGIIARCIVGGYLAGLHAAGVTA